MEKHELELFRQGQFVIEDEVKEDASAPPSVAVVVEQQSVKVIRLSITKYVYKKNSIRSKKEIYYIPFINFPIWSVSRKRFRRPSQSHRRRPATSNSRARARDWAKLWTYPFLRIQEARQTSTHGCPRWSTTRSPSSSQASMLPNVRQRFPSVIRLNERDDWW